MRVFRKFRASDGSIKIATLSGVSVSVAVIALLVGVLPVFAAAPGPTEEGVDPVQVDWGGGDGACDDDLNSLEDEDRPARGPSAAEYELHINNPVPGTNTYTGPDPDGTQITITVDENDEFFAFSIESGMAAYDVVVNGGKKSNHYEYDGGPGIVPSDSHLSAPAKENKDTEVHKLSHINLCYDAAEVTFTCDGAAEDALRFGDGIFVEAKGQIFNNFNADCVDEKQGLFFIDNQAEENQAEEATLDFGDEGKVAGRLDVTKDFTQDSTPNNPTDFEDLKYDPDGNGFVVVEWCETREFVENEDGDQFSDWLPTTGDDASYPSLPSEETACKVAEDEDLSGTQVTVVYFEFEDPQFR